LRERHVALQALIQRLQEPVLLFSEGVRAQLIGIRSAEVKLIGNQPFNSQFPEIESRIIS
jgi:hypothetical protein